MKKQILRSPLFYVGDKYKLMEEIGTYFPDNIGKFVEPFVGGGSVFMNTVAEQFCLNDIDGYIIGLHKYLSKSANKKNAFFADLERIIKEYGLSYSCKEDSIPMDLKSLYKKTYFAKYNKKAYEQMRSDFNESSKDNMSILYLLLIYGFNRMLRFNKRGDFNLPVGNVDFNSNVVSALENYFQEGIILIIKYSSKKSNYLKMISFIWIHRTLLHLANITSCGMKRMKRSYCKYSIS